MYDHYCFIVDSLEKQIALLADLAESSRDIARKYANEQDIYSVARYVKAADSNEKTIRQIQQEINALRSVK